MSACDLDDLNEADLEALEGLTDDALAARFDQPDPEPEPDDPLAGIPKNPARGPQPTNPYRSVDTLPPL